MQYRGAWCPIALVTRDAATKIEEAFDRIGIDTIQYMYPPRPDLPETQFVLYKIEVRFRDEERACRILSNIISPGSGER
jgi:hypothetical protein